MSSAGWWLLAVLAVATGCAGGSDAGPAPGGDAAPVCIVAKRPCSGSTQCGASLTCTEYGCVDSWAEWPMPNSPGLGLPNEQSYDTSTKGVVVDQVTGLTWQRDADPGSYTWCDAHAYCDKLSLGGHDDWRVPSAIELVSLLDFNRSHPAIDGDAFPATPAEPFWSIVPWAIDTSMAWYVDFDLGASNTATLARLFRVRCVRGQATPPASRYVIKETQPAAGSYGYAPAEGGADPAADAGEDAEADASADGEADAGPDGESDASADAETDAGPDGAGEGGASLIGTVSDTQTKLTWQRIARSDSISINDATQYCETLELDGSGWRLPSVKELATLVDYSASDPSIDTGAFPGTTPAFFRSSSPWAGGTDYMAYVFFKYGTVYGDPGPAHVRCVR